MLRVVAELGIEEDDQGSTGSRVVDQIGGPQQTLRSCLVPAADTPDRLRRLPRPDPCLPRLHGRERRNPAGRPGVRADGAIVAERTIAQVERMLEVPIESAIVPSMVKVASDADRERVRDVVRDEAYPAELRSSRRSRASTSPLTREEPGLWSAPTARRCTGPRSARGPRSSSTPSSPPDRPRGPRNDRRGRRAISRAAGFGTTSTPTASSIEADPANMPSSKDELVARATEDIERGPGRCAAVLRRPSPHGCRGSYRSRSSRRRTRRSPTTTRRPPDGSRPGIYYANGYDLPSRTYTKLATTTYHEAVPGHHFQITLEMENPNLNTFRRLGSRMVGAAFVEGWGLYSERLADEMGLFRSEGERFGMLDAQAWRAARLVVDTGMHALRWPRQQSIDFLQRIGLSETDAVIETDRYICWPGQALTYKIGQREIERLRAELTARDGGGFDIRTFHDAVLGHGSLPLATFARELPAWVVAGLTRLAAMPDP